MTDWNDEIALVVGAGGDIGKAIAHRLLDRGARVAASDRSPITMPGHPALRTATVDATSSRDVSAWMDAVADEWGAPTVLVVASGTSGSSHLVDVDEEEWRGVLSACLDAPFVTATAAIRRMIRAGRGGRVVFVGSWAAAAPHPHIGAYTVAKAGLRGLMRTLALDHARQGILVNEVAPGIVAAGLSRALFDRDEELRRRTLASIPLQRTLDVDDVARDVLFLASPDNVSTTGATLVSDGGLSLASSMNPGT